MCHFEEKKPFPEFLRQLWRKHWITIVVAALDFVIILYSIVGIMKVGFHDAAGLFGIGIFVWFCLSFSIAREHCGDELYKWLIQPVSEWFDNHWKTLRWYDLQDQHLPNYVVYISLVCLLLLEIMRLCLYFSHFRFVYGALLIAIIVFLAVDTRKKPIRFLSVFGLLVYIFIGFLFSKYRSKVTKPR